MDVVPTLHRERLSMTLAYDTLESFWPSERHMAVTPPLIMIVNDAPQIRAVFAFLLQSAGYRTATHACHAGAHALIKEMQPALLILDIVMEEHDSGWHLLDELRHDLATDELPVLIHSARTDVAQCMRERTDPWCTLLPFDMRPDSLLTHVQQQLPINR